MYLAAKGKNLFKRGLLENAELGGPFWTRPFKIKLRKKLATGKQI
ncbi:hypothetical protein MSSD1_307 [Mycoplasmopsis synoviae]